MTYNEQLKHLNKLLTEAFVAVKDNYGMPNSHEVAEYLLENGIDVHYMKDRAECYRIIPSYECTDFNDNFCIGSCDECRYGKRSFEVKKSFYSATNTNHCDDYNFGKTVFATKEEAEAKAEEMQAAWRLKEEEINS